MILLFGGTSDSLMIMERLCELKEKVALSVATDYGKIFSKAYAPYVIQKRMDQAEMETYMRENQVDLVIDASHPFAEIVSQNAMLAAQKLKISYLRYERARTVLPDYVEKVESIEMACRRALTYLEQDETIYLTTGSKTLQEYLNYVPSNRLVVRVLPTAEVLQKCEDLELEAQQIHAIKGPFSQELNEALYQKANAKVMITKESGLSGGTDVKIAAAHAMQMHILMIERPTIKYPLMFESIDGLMDYLVNERKRD